MKRITSLLVTMLVLTTCLLAQNVGIGTTTPVALLDVAGDISINGLKLGRGSGNSDQNIRFGTQSMINNTTGIRNIALGYYTLYLNSTGNYNVALGAFSLLNNTTGSSNTALGDDVLSQNISGQANTGVGSSALYLNNTGFNNVALGEAAGYLNSTGSKNTFIGRGANPAYGNLTNATAIGHQAYVAASNSLVLGSINGVNGASANTNVGIGTTIPTARLDVAGTLNATAWKTSSMTNNGYAEMGGVLIQWGTIAYLSNEPQTVTFPEPFSTVYSVTATVDAGNNTGNGVNVPVKLLNVGTSTFQIAGTLLFTGDITSKVRWMAIGIN